MPIPMMTFEMRTLQDARDHRGRNPTSAYTSSMPQPTTTPYYPVHTMSSSDLTPNPLRVAVGSKNKAKLKSVESVVQKLFGGLGRPIHVSGYSVESMVSCQPMSDTETMEGAVCRAKNALREDAQATFAVGLEGGVQKIGDGWFESGWIAVVDRNGKLGLGSSGRFQLSNKIMSRLMSGQEELADVIDDLSGQTDVRSTQGAMGIFTNGHVPRDVAYTHGVYFAFAPFISNSVYWDA